MSGNATAASPLLGKPDALAMLAAQIGSTGPVPTRAAEIAELIARLPVLTNDQLLLRPHAEIAGATHRLIVPARERPVARPVFTNGRPDSFPEQSGIEQSPAFECLELAGGFLAQISRAPVVVAADRVSIAQDFSSPYAGLVHGYDFNMRALLDNARRVEGSAVVLCDDIHPLNFCHWMLDELPRLALLGEDREVTVISHEEDAPFKRETLRLCGFPPSRVVRLGDFQAVQADRLLVPRDIADMPHPAFKAAPWVLDFLRNRLGFSALAAQPGPSPSQRKLFVSRDDSTGRRIINEAELMRALGAAGYERITLSGRSVAEQIALFARATHVVGVHGAGLSNFAFAPRGGRLLEIFPRTYGMATYYVLAAGQGCPYATYIANEVIPGDRPQTDDIRIDVADFMRCCGALL